MAQTGVKVTFTGDWPELKRAVRRVREFPFARFHASAGETIINQVHERFDREAGPDGKPWPKSGRVQHKGGKTLTDTARLRNSITKRASDRQVDVGTNARYAAIHQAGGVIKAKHAPRLVFEIPGAGMRTAKKVKMPARPYMGFNEDNRRELGEELQDFLAALVRGRR